MILAVLTAACAMGMAACGGNGNTLIVYTEAGFAPFEYIKDSKIVGADVDIMNLVGEELGMSVQFENVAFDQIVDTVSAGKLAKVGAAGISITDERKEKVAFSVPYYTANLYVIYQVTDAATYESTTTDDVTGVYWDAFADKKSAYRAGRPPIFSWEMKRRKAAFWTERTSRRRDTTRCPRRLRISGSTSTS